MRTHEEDGTLAITLNESLAWGARYGELTLVEVLQGAERNRPTLNYPMRFIAKENMYWGGKLIQRGTEVAWYHDRGITNAVWITLVGVKRMASQVDSAWHGTFEPM